MDANAPRNSSQDSAPGPASDTRPSADPEMRSLEHLVHWTLLLGLAISTMLLIAGLALSLGRDEHAAAGLPGGLAKLARGAISGSSEALLDLGILALICTPVLRVAVLAVGWLAWGDRRFALTALVVLALLALGMTLGLG